MALTIDIVTLFPNFFKSPLSESLLKKAQERGLVKVHARGLRDWTHDRHRTADDKPFGGGAGMVMKPEPIFECVEEIGKKAWTVLLDPKGEPMSQKIAQKLAKKKHLVLIAGHYEGVDQRVKDHLVDQEISVGDFITMGGEAPALCLIEAIVRLIPGVLGNAESVKHESFQSGILECPHYTRPREYRGWKVPDALMSGNHKELHAWRKKNGRADNEEKKTRSIKVIFKEKKMSKMSIIEKEFESKKVSAFRVGDTLKVHLRVKEGDKTRIQIFEGICIRKKGRGANASFSVLKESYGDMVEKVFPLYSPVVEKVTVSTKGKARRSKLYYLKHAK